MVNFGPVNTIPASFKGRNLYKHNPNVTLMRTSIQECGQLGRIIGLKLNKAKGPTAVFVPLKGISSIAIEHEVFYDPEADRALIDSLKGVLESHVQLVVMDTDINDARFAEAMADKMHQLIQTDGVFQHE
jgi:uncharacterized protein (UPF0261 family)